MPLCWPKDKARRITSWSRFAPTCRSASLATLLVCAEARAESEPIRIEYRADAGCPTRRDFEERVFDRTASARLAGTGESARTFSVDLRRRQRRVTGRLVISEPNGATMTRRVTGSDCGDVATVLALATALAIDPRAELAPHETLEEPESRTGPYEAEASSARPAQAPADESQDETPAAGADALGPTARMRAYAALGARARFLVAPKPAWGASATIGARSGDEAGSDLFLELAYLATAAERIQGATATFRFVLARPGVCPFGTSLGGAVRVSPCVAAELGAVTARGADLPFASASTRFFGSAELFLRADVKLSPVFFLSLDAGASAPFTRYEFLFENPDTRIHRVPPLTAGAGVRLGARL